MTMGIDKVSDKVGDKVGDSALRISPTLSPCLVAHFVDPHGHSLGIGHWTLVIGHWSLRAVAAHNQPRNRKKGHARAGI